MASNADPRVDAYIDALPAWQQAVCQQVRSLVHAADPAVEETIKRRVQPYFVLQGNICALLATKDHVNVFLYDGAIVPDPERHHHRRPRQQDRPHGRDLPGRADQRTRADRDVPADHRQQPGRWLAPAQEHRPSLSTSRRYRGAARGVDRYPRPGVAPAAARTDDDGLDGGRRLAVLTASADHDRVPRGAENGESMKTRAAVLPCRVGQPFEITELDLDEPKAGEVLIRYAAAGPVPLRRAPAARRHRAALPARRRPRGRRRHRAGRAGRDPRCKPGDHVICSFLPVCGHCRWCSTGKSEPVRHGRRPSWTASCTDGDVPVPRRAARTTAACACSARSPSGR